MSESVLVQSRVPKESKDRATEVLKSIGLNMSTYLNMAIDQLIIQGKVPFEAKTVSSPVSFGDAINDVASSFAFEDMKVTERDKRLLQQLWHGDMTLEQYKQIVLAEEKAEEHA